MIFTNLSTGITFSFSPDGMKGIQTIKIFTATRSKFLNKAGTFVTAK